jgi:trans-aconitate methyltransferase
MPDADLGFRGEIADLYHRYRHGYPEPAIAAIARIFGLTDRDVTVDLGCGTGQLTLPMAARVRAVLGVDPEPDMLMRARRAAGEAGLTNVSWMIGADSDMVAIRALLGSRAVGALTVGQALHWMNHPLLFSGARPLFRSGGGIAVVTNGTPLWLQDTDWSRAIREILAGWLGHRSRAACGTDEQSQQRYREDLAAAGYDVVSAAVDYDVELTVDQIAGGIYSALGADRLPTSDQRAAFAERIADAIAPRDHVIEQVHVAVVAGRIR